jgi:hypothetical protein
LAMEKQTKTLSLTGWTWWWSHGRRGALVHAQSLAEKPSRGLQLNMASSLWCAKNFETKPEMCVLKK